MKKSAVKLFFVSPLSNCICQMKVYFVGNYCKFDKNHYLCTIEVWPNFGEEWEKVRIEGEWKEKKRDEEKRLFD
jgi:hypothetical protein